LTGITLLASTGIASVDQALRQCVELIEQALPGRVRGYYLVGSYAYGEALPASDIDMIVLLEGELAQADCDRFAAVREQCRQKSQPPLDLTLASEAKLLRVGGVWFQTASVFLYGEDVRPRIPRKPVANHIRDLMHAVLPLFARVRGGRLPMTFPLDYPDPAGPLYGYDSHYRESSQPHLAVTKDLVTNVLAAANALTLRAARQYVGSGKKSDIPSQYAIWVGGESAALVDEIFTCCRVRWGYRAPEARAERERLRDLCRDALRFENMFLECYRDMLLADLQSEDVAARLAAARRFGQVIYPDPAVASALTQLAARAGAETQQAAVDALAYYQPFTSA
jgi:predicted nucleotidyltransferase